MFSKLNGLAVFSVPLLVLPQIFLPDEWAEALKRLAEERGAPVGVVARQAVIEWLREWTARDGYPRATITRAADAPGLYDASAPE